MFWVDMPLEDVFGRILGMKEPWYVEDVAFDTRKLEVDIYVGFRTGSQLPCPECGELCPVQFTMTRRSVHGVHGDI